MRRLRTDNADHVQHLLSRARVAEVKASATDVLTGEEVLVLRGHWRETLAVHDRSGREIGAAMRISGRCSDAAIGRPQLQDPWLSAAIAQGAQINGGKVASTTSTASGTQGFHFDDAAIGAGVIAGLTLIGMAGVLTVRRRSQLQRP